MSDSNGGFEAIGAFVVGGLLGAVVAALTAPNRGEKTREELTTCCAQSLGKFAEMRGISKEKLSSTVNLMKEKVKDLGKCFDDITSQGIGVLVEDEIL